MPPSYSSLILAWCLVPTAPSLQTNKPQLHNTKWVYTYSTHTHKMFTLRLVHPHSFLLSLLLVLSSCPFFLSLLTHPFFSPSCPLLPHGTFHVSSFGQHKTNTKACVLLPQTCLASKKNKQKEKVQTTTTKVDKRRQIPDMRLKPFQIFGWHEFCVGCPPCFSTAGKLNEVKIGRALLVCVAAQSLNRR